MKKKIWSVLILLMALVSCAGIFSACGKSRQNLSLESDTKSINLVLGDENEETAEIEVDVVGKDDGISGIVGFEIIGECAKVESVSTKSTSSKASCVVRAVRSGKSILRATLYDGGASLEIPIEVEQRVVSMTAKSDTKPYVVKGAGKVVFDAEKLINFYPISTTQRNVYFMVGGEISDGFEAPLQDERQSVEVFAINSANENIHTQFTLRLVDPISEIASKVDGVEGNNVVLATNSATKNTSRVDIVVKSAEKEITCLNGYHLGDDYNIRMTNHAHAGGVHTFTFEISGIAGDTTGEYVFKFGIGEEFDYYETYSVDISTVVVAKKIAIGLETEDYSTLRVFNYNSTNSKGTTLNFSVLPNNVQTSQRAGTILYDNNYITIYNNTKNIISSGERIQSGTTLYVQGVTNVVGNTEIRFLVEGMQGVSDDIVAIVPVVVHEGAKEIAGADSIVLKLADDGSASDEIFNYEFDVLPSGAYSGDVWVEAKSTIIALQKEENSNTIKIKALSSGKTKIVMTLGNGVTKTVEVEVICEMNENSLILDAPNSTESEFVGRKQPVVVSRAIPLQQLVIQKSRAYEKAVPLNFSYYPQNASNIEYNYTITKISGEKENIVEIVGNSLVGRNEGKARVEVEVSYVKFVDGQKEIRSQTFSFEVEVYVAVNSFYFSDTTVTVADINSVGFYKLSEATKKIQSYIYPNDATNKKIVYYLDEEEAGGEILENDLISFNVKTGEIIGKVESGTSIRSSTITAKLVDFTREYVVTIEVNVEKYELVRNIVIDNVASNEIILSAGHPTFQIIAHAEKITANNRTLVYSFIPKNEESIGVISVTQTGLVQLDVNRATTDGLGGTLRVSAQDSFKRDNINADTYRDIKVSVAIGTKDSPYPISSAEELLALNSAEALAKYYKIVGVIDLKGKPISPLGELTGGIIGTTGAKIIGINIVGDTEGNAGLFAKLAPEAFVKNVGFAGAINYAGEAQNVGLLAGINNGTIENCSVELGKSEIRMSAASCVGGLVGTNNSKITNIIEIDKSNFSLMRHLAEFFVEGTNEFDVVVGGVVGKNALSGIIFRQIHGVSLYGFNGYTANVKMRTEKTSATGAIVGINEGSCLSLASCGKIVGEKSVGGYVGHNNGRIGLEDNTENSARSFSNTFVRGTQGVGGFVGDMTGGTITSSGVEIYEQASYLENERYIAYATGYVGGFVGTAYAGNITECYVASFRTGTDILVCMDSDSVISKAGAFVGNLTGATIAICNSNIKASKLSLGGIDDTIYSDVVSVMPPVPTTVELEIVKNEMKTDDESFSDYKVVYLDYYEAQKKDEQSILDYLNKLELGKIISHGLGDAGAEISSSDSSIIKIEGDGIKVVSRGLCEIAITSRFNPNLKSIVYVWVVGANEKIGFSQTSNESSYPVLEGSTILARADQVTSFDKNNLSMAVDGVQLAVGGNYNILSNNNNFVLNNYENLFTIGLSSEYLNKIKNDEITNFVEQINFGGAYSIYIGGRKFTSDTFASLGVTARVLAGITNFYLSSSNLEMCANDQLKIGFDFSSTLEDNEELSVSVNRDAYINGKLVSSGTKEKIYKKDLTSKEFVLELVDKYYTGTLKLVFSDKNNTFQKEAQIKVLPQNVEVIATRYFDSNPNDINRASTSLLITPGKPGVLVLDIIPRQADLEYITIQNAETNPIFVQFDFVNSNYFKIPGATLYAGGIKIPTKLFTNNGVLSTLFVKTIVETQVSDNQPLKLVVGTSDGYKKEFVLTTKHTEKVVGQIENRQSGVEVKLAKGLDYKLNITSVGFTQDQIRVESSRNGVVSISKTNDFIFNIHANKIAGTDRIILKVYGEKEVDGMTVRTTIQEIAITVQDYVVYEKINFEGASESSLSSEYDIVTGYVGVSKKLGVELINGVNCEYDITDSQIVYNLKAFEEKLNKEGKFTPEKGTESEEFNFVEDNIVYPKQEMSAENSKTTFKFEYTIDGVTYHATMKMNVENISTSSSMIPISTYQELLNMTEGNYYILTEDITLPETFSPIVTAIAGFDGNNKKITMTRFKNHEKSSVNFGLFEEVKEDAIIQNVHIYVNNFETTIISDELNFGFIAAINNGIITNCFVEGNSARIVVNESAANTSSKQIGGIVAENNGYITNSRVEISIFSAYGNVAGIATTNANVISSSFVKNSTIINNSTITDAMTAGIVCENKNGARIFGCYIEGGAYGQNAIYCDTSVSIRANAKIAAFVFANAGEVQDSYANIHIRSGSVASGFVYENQQNGIILNSFSLSLLQKNMSNNFAFVAFDPAGLVDTTAGTFKSCYYCKEINNWQSSQKVDGIVELEQMEDFSKRENFVTFGLSSELAPEKGVWTLISNSRDELKYPSLISANNIITTTKVFYTKIVDEVTGGVIYKYLDMPDGSMNNPFIISSASELEQKILQTTQTDLTCSSYIRIVADINYSNDETGVKLSGLHKVKFCGELDGNGLKVTGLNINSEEKVDSAGWFASIGTNIKAGVVKNLILIPSQINLPNVSKAGALAGTILGSGVYNVSVETSNVTNVIMIKGQNFVGGIAGLMMNSQVFNSQMINCNSELNINATSLSQTSDETKKNSTGIYIPTQTVVNINLAALAGGVVGYMQGGTMAFCESRASVVMGQIAGGLVGYVGGGARVEKSSTNIADKNYIRSSFVAGGLVGMNNGTINHSEVLGNATNYFKNGSVAPVAVGGLVGINNGDVIYSISSDEKSEISLDIDNIDISFVGGVAGIMRSGTISNYHIVSNLRGSTNVGGVVGVIQNGIGTIKITDCIVGKIIVGTNAKEYETTIIAYGFEVNSVGVIVGKKTTTKVTFAGNICKNAVKFSRIWINGEENDSVYDKSFKEVDSTDAYKDKIITDFAESDSN